MIHAKPVLLFIDDPVSCIAWYDTGGTVPVYTLKGPHALFCDYASYLSVCTVRICEKAVGKLEATSDKQATSDVTV